MQLLTDFWIEYFNRYKNFIPWEHLKATNDWRSNSLTLNDIKNVTVQTTLQLECELNDGSILRGTIVGKQKQKVRFRRSKPTILKQVVDVASLPQLDYEMIIARFVNLQQKANGYVYFVQLCNNDQLVKIGFSRNIINRWGNCKPTDNPYNVRILATCQASRIHEILLHKEFKTHVFRGEWFLPSVEILQLAHDLNGFRQSNFHQLTNSLEHSTIYGQMAKSIVFTNYANRALW